MTFRKAVSFCLALCIMATLGVAICGCDDLGAFEDTEEYYASFGDIVLLNEDSKEEYDIEEYFYNKESRNNFLKGDDGVYKGVDFDRYVYMAVPFEKNINMDSFALYLQAKDDVTVYINVYVTDKIPSNWKTIEDNVTETETETETETDVETDVETDLDTETETETETEIETETETETERETETENTEAVYDDPDSDKRVGELTVHLKSGKWNSFILDTFRVDGEVQKSIEINKGQYVLLQIINNSGLRVFSEEKQAYVDPQTGNELDGAELTMTNLLIRALDDKNVSETQGGE